jgi:hypothetical protein
LLERRGALLHLGGAGFELRALLLVALACVFGEAQRAFQFDNAVGGRLLLFRDPLVTVFERRVLLAQLRVLGLDVRCGDATHRFLPLAVCTTAGDRIAVASALVLMDDAFYRERGRPLAGLRGRTVRHGGREGELVDVLVDSGGGVRAYVVTAPRGGEQEIPASPDVLIAGDALRPAV